MNVRQLAPPPRCARAAASCLARALFGGICGRSGRVAGVSRGSRVTFGEPIERAPSARARALADRTHAVGVRCARASVHACASNWARAAARAREVERGPRKPVRARMVERREGREHATAAPAPVQVAGRGHVKTRKPSRGCAAASVATVGVPGGESDFWAAAGAEKGWGVDRRSGDGAGKPLHYIGGMLRHSRGDALSTMRARVLWTT